MKQHRLQVERGFKLYIVVDINFYWLIHQTFASSIKSFLLSIHQCLSACIHVCVCDRLWPYNGNPCWERLQEVDEWVTLWPELPLYPAGTSLRSSHDFTAKPHPMRSVVFTLDSVPSAGQVYVWNALDVKLSMDFSQGRNHVSFQLHKAVGLSLSTDEV